MMSHYNIFQAFFMSFYSRKLYLDVGKNWGGKTFLYLFLLLAVSWVGTTIHFQRSLNKGYAIESEAMLAQLPVLTVTDGVVSTPENKPYFITDPMTDKTFAIIDTTGKYTELAAGENFLLITPKKVITKQKKNETKIYDIPKDYTGTINPVTINGYISAFIGYTWIPFFFFCLIGSFIYRILQALLYSLLGKLFSTVSNSNVSYGSILQIVMVALTPCITLSTILDIFGCEFPKEYLTYFIITMLYMIYGIRANKS